MYTIGDTLENEGITRVVLISDGDDVTIVMEDFMGKRSVLDPQYYAKIFTVVVDAAEPPGRDPIILTFALNGYGWHVTATPRYGVNTDAALAAFLEALNHPD